MCSEEPQQQTKPAPRPVAARPVPPPIAAAVPASYEEMHDHYVQAFVESEGLGISRLPRPKMASRPHTVKIGNKTLAITAFNLIGIAKHNPPVVHLNYQHMMSAPQVGLPEPKPKNLNNIRQIATQQAEPTPETRKLTGFEESALALFRNGGELGQGMGKDKQERLVVAPIRATQQCVKCHEGTQEGDLLGAFTYRLGPAPTAVPHAPRFAGEVPILGR